MDIKAELRLIRKNDPNKWCDEITQSYLICPSDYSDELKDNDGCQCFNCEECWDKAIEEEVK